MAIRDVIGEKFIHLPQPTLVNLYQSAIGAGTRVASFVEIGRAKIGARCKIGAFTFICEGVTIEDDVFVGPHVCFTNDLHPRANTKPGEWTVSPTVVRKGSSIGAGSTILCGIEIGEGAVIGAGSVVTRSVPAGGKVHGKRARAVRESIRFALMDGHVNLRRGAKGESAYRSIEDVLKIGRVCAELGFPMPHSITLNSAEFDRIAGMLG